MKVQRERWPCERVDAEGKPWRVRNAPLVLLTRTRLKLADDREGDIGPMWSYTLTGVAVIAIAVPILGLGFALVALFWNHLALVWKASALLVGFIAIAVALGMSFGYRRIRRAAVALERAAAGQCLSCGQSLVHSEASPVDRCRCTECGHVWPWPLPALDPGKM